MAAAPWNRVNIPFPAAVSCVRAQFTHVSGEDADHLRERVSGPRGGGVAWREGA